MPVGERGRKPAVACWKTARGAPARAGRCGAQSPHTGIAWNRYDRDLTLARQDTSASPPSPQPPPFLLQSSPQFAIVQFEHILEPPQLAKLCERIATAKLVCFDTEFVSEDTYFPQLGLIQVAVDSQLAIIDPLAVPVEPFWQALADGNHVTVVHAGREELRFCRRAVGRGPSRLFDAQIAAGLVSQDYPAAYSTLISKFVGRQLAKGETRTDWRRRPLSKRQIDYALQDVVHLTTLYQRLTHKLEELGRTSWLSDEMDRWEQAVADSDTQERWRRVSGVSGLSPRQLAVLRELWRWRRQEAQRRDRPQRRVIRDDLLIELSRRQSADPKQIRAIRGFERRNYQRMVDDLSERISVGLALPDERLPGRDAGPRRPQMTLLGQFLSAALSALCRERQVAAALVGGAEDVRDLVSYRLGLSKPMPKDPPALARGWRSEVVGQVIDDLVAGRLFVGVANPQDSQPLQFITATDANQ